VDTEYLNNFMRACGKINKLAKEIFLIMKTTTTVYEQIESRLSQV
jgi:uncharacterized protein involved in tolerance to divalent cations